MLAEDGRKLIDDLFGGSLREQSGSLLVMPGDRACTEAKFHLVEGKGGFTGSILTWRRVGERLYDHFAFEFPVADLSSREIMVRRVMENTKLPSLKVRGKARSTMVFHVTREIGDLIAGGVDPEDLKSTPGMKSDLGNILAGYLKMLDENEIVDSDQIPSLVTSRIRKGADLPWSRMAVFLPVSLPGSWEDMMEALGERMDTREVIEDPFSSGGSRFSIPSRGKRGRQTIGSAAKVPLIREMTPFNEVESIARLLKKRILEGTDIHRCAVVFPSRRRYDSLIKVLFKRYGIPVDMGNDLRLDQVPVVDCILTYLSLPLEGYGRDDLLKITGFLDTPGLDWRDLERLSRKAFILDGGRDAADRWVDDLLSLSEDQDTTDRDSRLAREWADYLERFFGYLKELAGGKKPVEVRCALVGDIISRLLSDELLSGREEDDPDVKGLDRFIQSLRSLRRRSGMLKMEPVGHSRFMEMLTSEVDKQKITTGASRGGVAVLGLKGALGIEFDLCIIGGCNADQLPGGPAGFRIIGERERMDLRMRSLTERRETLEQMTLLMNSSREIVLSCHSEKGGRPVPISSFIEGLDLEEMEKIEGLFSTVDIIKRVGELEDPALDLYDRREGEVDSIMYDRPSLAGMLPESLRNRIERGLAGRRNRCSAGPNDHRGTILDEASIAALRERFGPDHVWSASKLETYRECPYSFFAKYVLGIREREDLEPGVPPEKKGLIFHAIADSFYSRWMDLGRSSVRAAELDQAWEVMRTAAIEELGRYRYSGPYWDALMDQLLGTDGDEGILLEFLKLESDYRGKFRVDGTEVKFGPSLSGGSVRISLPGSDEGFLMQGSIDRVDRMRSSGGDLHYIWDYKTGSRDIPEDSLQVPLYLSALRRMHPDVFPGGGGYYYIRRKGSLKRDPVLGREIWDQADDSGIDKVSSRITDDINVSLEIIDSVRCGMFPPDPSCRSRFCPFVNMCRRGENQ